MGSLEFIATVTRFEPYLSQFPQEMIDYWYGFPWWMFAVWGIANFAGLAGAVLLLMKNKLAVPLFGASFACVVISMFVSILEPGPEGEGGGVMALVIIAIAAALLVYVWRMRTRGAPSERVNLVGLSANRMLPGLRHRHVGHSVNYMSARS